MAAAPGPCPAARGHGAVPAPPLHRTKPFDRRLIMTQEQHEENTPGDNGDGGRRSRPDEVTLGHGVQEDVDHAHKGDDAGDG